MRIRALSVFLGAALVWPLVVRAQIEGPDTLTPVVPRGPIAKVIEPQAGALLQASFDRLARAQSIRGWIRTDTYKDPGYGRGPNATPIPDSIRKRPLASEFVRFQGMKPGYLRTDSTGIGSKYGGRVPVPPPAPSVSILTPGKGWRFTIGDTSAQEVDPAVYWKYSVNALIHSFFPVENRRMFPGEWSPQRMHDYLFRSARYVGREAWKGREYDVVEWVTEYDWSMPSDTVLWTTRVYIGREDTLARRIVSTPTRGYRIEHELLELSLDEPMTAADFALPTANALAIRPRRPDTSLAGRKLPELAATAQMLDGSKVKLADLLKRKKAVVFWPWAYG